MTWNPDSEQPPPNPLFAILGGRPPTEEELAQKQKELDETIEKGKVTYLTLQRYDPYRKCVKCGSDKQAESRHMETCFQAGNNEIIARTCKRCGYRWMELPLDVR